MRTLHNSLYVSSDRYRTLISATTKTNTEGAVWIDEYLALKIMHGSVLHDRSRRRRHAEAGHHDVLHAVLLADGLGGSLESGRQHVATVKEEMQEGYAEDTAARMAFRRACACRR